MADWLLLRLPPSAPRQASWLVVDARGAPTGPPQAGPLALAAARTAGRHVVALVPGAEVLLAEPELPPAKAGAKLHQLVPYALEEQLAQDIDELHFAVGRRQSDSARVPVAVVARKLMDEWLGQLRGAGIEPEAMYAESELLPRNPGQAVALLDDEVIVVRPPAGAVVTLPTDALPEALEIAAAGAEAGASGGRGLILYTGPAEWQRRSEQVEAVRERFDGIKIQLLSGGPLSLFAQQLPAAVATNLLQGPYAPAISQPVGWRAWRIAAILLAALVGLHVTGKAAELMVLRHTDSRLDASISQVFHTAMPGEQSTYEARRRMQQRLAAARAREASGGFLTGLEALAKARGTVPQTVMRALTFRDGALEIELSAPNAEALAQLSRELRQAGWQARLVSGNPAGSAYLGRIEMKRRS
jgi:general secretion pathway protein L